MYIKQILLELDDRCARDLERVAPAGKRVRAEFIRLGLRRAIDRATEHAYREKPLPPALSAIGRRPVLLLGRSSALAYLGRTLAAEVTTTIRAIPQEVCTRPVDFSGILRVVRLG